MEFSDLPEICTEKIFRFLNLDDQKSFHEAFYGTPQDHVLERIKCHKQTIQCWICMSKLFLSYFWHGSQKYKSGRVPPGGLIHEPKHATKGFTLLYTLKSVNSGRKVFTLRKRQTSDTDAMDAIFDDFDSHISTVFTARSAKELKEHLVSEHFELSNFPPVFFENFEEMESEFNNHMIKILKTDKKQFNIILKD